METECYCTSLRVATRRVSAIYDRALEPIGVNIAQWAVLRRLPRPDQDGISIQDLAERLELERSTVARNVRVLEKAGLIAIGSSASDRRASTIVLTDEALGLLDRGRPLWQAAQEEIEQILGVQVATNLRAAALSI